MWIPSKSKAFLNMLRPANCVMMGIGVLTGELITLRGDLEILPSLLGFLTAFTLTGASMAINDYFDRFVDAINQPSRPLPSGLVSPGEAIGFALALGMVGLISAGLSSLEYHSPLPFLIAAFSLFLSSYYSVKGKRMGLIGNIMVSTCVGIPFVYGSLIVGVGPTPPLILFVLMAFLSNTGREILKGIADVKGDRVRGVKTLALTIGPRQAAFSVLGFYLAAVVLSPLPLLYRIVSLVYLPLVFLADVGLVLTAIQAVSTPTPAVALKLKKLSLVWMFFGLLAFICGVSI